MSYYNGKRDKANLRKKKLILKWAKKLKAIKLLGGKCEVCGEKRPWLLDFHHKNSDDKENEYNKISLSSWDMIEQEIIKCSLLCRNCHGDIHYKDAFIEFEKEINEKCKQIKGNANKNKVKEDKVIELRSVGFTQKEISKELGCAISTVCDILKRNGIHTEVKKRKLDPYEVKRLRDEGLSNVEISQMLNIHRFTVPRVLKKLKDGHYDKHNNSQDLD